MSSRIYRPGEERPTSPVPWRQIHDDESASKNTGRTVDWQAQIAAVERDWQERAAEAHTAGLQEGEAQAHNRAMAAVQPLLQQLTQTIAQLAGERARLRRQAEAEMVQLSLAIARRVLRRELAVDPEALHGLVLGALERLEAREVTRVRVHPSHAASISELLRKPPGGGVVEIIPDATRALGTVIFETERGNLDASVETQLQEIERGLADCLRRRG